MAKSASILRVAARRGVSVPLLLAALGLVGVGCTDAGRCPIDRVDPGTGTCMDGGGGGPGTACSNTCGDTVIGEWANDGFCDDGGPGADYAACAYGSDCGDCGARPAPVCDDPDFPVFCTQSASCWEATVDCFSVRECPGGSFYACMTGFEVDCSLSGADRCVVPTVCSDSCPTADDGTCDDGGATASKATCRLGTDCTDCGPRESPCAAEGEYSVFCPATPNAPSDCWSQGTDCDSVQWCVDTYQGCNDGYRFDCATETCVLAACTDPTLPVDCGTGVCFPPDTDCTTVTTCPVASAPTACPFGYMVDCIADPANGTCVLPPPM